MPSAPRILLTLAALCLVATMASKCPEDCTTFKAEAPPKPEDPGTNTLAALAKILDGVLTFMRAKNLGEMANNIGYMAGGLFTGVWGATHADNPSKWAEYKMAMQFKQNQDFLSCVMESQVSGAVYDINQRLDADRIGNFNSAVDGVVSWIQDNCAAHNCLNTTGLDPAKRNAATGSPDASCVAAYKPITDCSNVTWDPKNPRLCRGADAYGATYEGVCSEDGQCWHSSIGFQGTIQAYQKMKQVFVDHPAINNFRAFDTLLNPNAVVAYAKATSVYLALMQELYFLGSASAEEANIKAFAARAAAWLQDRVDFHTNFNVSMKTVLDASSMGEPTAVRASCKPADVIQRWWGCSNLNFTATKTYCLLQPYKLGNTEPLCAADCSDSNTKAFYQSRPDLFTVSSLESAMNAGADLLSSKNKKLFTNAAVYKVIESLKAMSTAPMPAGSFKLYQDVYTPRLVCRQSPKLLLQGGEQTVAPLGTWEAPDNLSKGSVVLRGVVIGGEAMKRVGGAPSNVVAPSKAAAAPAPRRLLL